MVKNPDHRLLEKGNYRGEYENPYVINNVTTDIGRVEVKQTQRPGIYIDGYRGKSLSTKPRSLQGPSKQAQQ